MVTEIMVSDEQAFHFLNGFSAKTLLELKQQIEKTDDEVYNHHVTTENNDFSNWIRACLKDPILANLCQNTHSKKEFLKIIEEYTKSKERPIKKGDENSIIKRDDEDNIKKIDEKKEDHKKSTQQSDKIKKVTEPKILQKKSSSSKESINKSNNLSHEQKKPIAPALPMLNTEKKKPILNTEKKKDHSIIWETKRINIGVPGFDQLINKGVPKGSSVLLCGGPGSGKTTFALQTLKAGIEAGEKCLYLTFEESEENLKRHLFDYGWDPTNALNKGNLIIKKVEPLSLSRTVEALLAKASGELLIEMDEIEGIIPKGFIPNRIVLDSLSAVAAAFAGSQEGYRIYVEQIFNLFKTTGASSFLITERDQSTERYSRSGIEEFLADAVFVFYNIRRENERVSAIEILKIRGTSFKKKIVPFKFTEKQGIIVYPQEEVF